MSRRKNNRTTNDYIAIHFSESEMERIENAAKLKRMTVHQYIRSVVLKDRKIPQLPRV